MTHVAAWLCLLSLVIASWGKLDSDEIESKLKSLEEEVRKLRDLTTGKNSLGNAEIDDDSRNRMQSIGILQRRKRSESSGLMGRDGRDGLPGENGRDGRDGVHGETGKQGAQGIPGPAGPAGSAGTPGKPYGGAVYTRWGRTVCGSNSALIYKGIVGSTRYDSTGGGTNYQCLPHDPEYNRYYSKNGGTGSWYGSYISGTEYQSWTSGIFPNEAHDNNAPCAVCLADSRPSGVMIPAKRTCPVGWHKEYEGYLMAERHVHKHQSTFECVDMKPEYVIGESASQDDSLLFFIRVQCSEGIPCPNYYSDRSLTCVYCTK